MSRIAITGGTGFVGTHVCHAVRDAGHQLRVVSRGRKQGLVDKGVERARASVVSGDGLAEALSGCDTVINLVAVIRQRGGQTYDAVNRQGTEHVARAAAEVGATHLIHLSALGVDPNPQYPYLASKWAGEQAVHMADVPATIVRSGLVFGPGDSFFTRLARLVRWNPVLPIVGNGRTAFQPIAVADLARAITQLVDSGPRPDAALEVGGPEHLTYEQIVDIIRETVWHLPQMKVHVPVAAMLPPAFLMDKLLPNPPVTPDQLRMLAKNTVTRLDAVPRHFGFAPISFRAGADYLQDA